ncbi:hypothetical protein, partial [Vibrio parahaemolyticus]|uniref:hypothetical protein n=1 Tax=Vibrio parahaemolyticus TaxID=670 RepID=UPI00211175BD
LCRIGAVGRGSLAIVVAALVAWCLQAFRGTASLLLAAGALALYGAAVAAALGGLHLVLPVALPLTAALFVLLGTTAWTHLTA